MHLLLCSYSREMIAAINHGPKITIKPKYTPACTRRHTLHVLHHQSHFSFWYGSTSHRHNKTLDRLKTRIILKCQKRQQSECSWSLRRTETEADGRPGRASLHTPNRATASAARPTGSSASGAYGWFIPNPGERKRGRFLQLAASRKTP